MKLLLVVAAALIDAERRVLIAQRPPGKSLGGLWEFPGGKVHAGESPEQALARELAEELAIEADAAQLEPFAFASHGYEDFHLLMPLYICRSWKGVVTAMEGQNLAWTPAHRLRDYEMPPADEPLIEPLAQWLRHKDA